MKMSVLKRNCILAVLSFLWISQSSASASQPIRFHGGNFDDAQTQARQLNKGVFVEIYASWCGPCKNLEQNVFTDGDVGKFFNESFVSVKIDIDSPEGKAFQSMYNVTGLPDLLFFDANGNIVYRQNGLQDKHTLLGMAHRVLNLPYRVVVSEEKPQVQNKRKRGFWTKKRTKKNTAKNKQRKSGKKKGLGNPFSKWSNNSQGLSPSNDKKTRKERQLEEGEPELLEYYSDSPNNYGDIRQARRTKKRLFAFDLRMPRFLQRKTDKGMSGKVIGQERQHGYVDVELTEEPVTFMDEDSRSAQRSDYSYTEPYTNNGREAASDPTARMDVASEDYRHNDAPDQQYSDVPTTRRGEWRPESHADRAYLKGERDLDFLRDYCYQLREEGKPHAEIVDKYLNRVYIKEKTGQEISYEERSQFVYDFSDNVRAGAIDYMLENRSKFYYRFGHDHTDIKIRSILMDGVQEAIQYQDYALFQRVVNLARKGDFLDELDLVFSLQATYFKGTGDMERYVYTVSKFVSKVDSFDPVFLNQFAEEVCIYSDNRGYLRKALKWSDRAVSLAPNSHNYNTHAQLSYKMGKRDQAYASARKAIQLANDSKNECLASEELLAKLQRGYSAAY